MGDRNNVYHSDMWSLGDSQLDAAVVLMSPCQNCISYLSPLGDPFLGVFYRADWADDTY